jgi:tetratricopeptide (TPR) repeat protein
LLGKYDLAITKAEAVAKAAQELKYRPLEAEALLVVGDLKDRTGDSATAVKVLEQAAVAANAGNDHQTAAEAWSTLAWVLGTGERNFDRAMWAVQMGRAAFEALGGSPELEAQLTNYEGLIYEAKGKLPEARAKLVAARDAYEKLGFTDTWQMSIVLNDLGGIERKLGHLDVAQEMHERALAIRTKLFGDAHPFVFSSLNNLGTVAWSRGDYAGAEAWFDKALACAIKVFPPQHPQTALVLSNLASVYDNEDKLDQSVATYRRALAMYEAMRGPDHPDVADTLRGLANVLREQDKGAEAAQAFERALTIMSAKQDDPTRVKLLADYGELLIATDPKRAETMLREAQTIVEEASSKTDPELGYSLTALGDLYTRTKRPALARGVLERALAIRTADGDTDPEDLAHTELALAQALWTTPKDRPRALALARGAQQRLEAAKATKRPGYRRVTAWLASHR